MIKVKYIYLVLFTLLFYSQLFGQEFTLFIHGGDNIPRDLLKQFSDVKGDSAEIQKQLTLLINGLFEEGYPSAAVDSIIFDRASVNVYLFLGDKYYWDKLDWSQLETDLLDHLKIKRKDFEIVNIEKFVEIRSDIISFYENSGYPFAIVKLDTFGIEGSKFSAFLSVQKGDFYTLDSIIVKGDAKVSYNYLKKALQLEPGIPFDQSGINDIGKKIADLNFISEIKPAEIEFKRKQVDLYLYLQNKKANMFNGIIGFLPESTNNSDENSEKLTITGDLKLGLVNPFGRGEEINLNWEKPESLTQKLKLDVTYPYLFKTNLGIDANFELFKKDTTFLSLNTGLGLRLFLNNKDYIKAYYRYKSSSKIGKDFSGELSINFADVKSNLFGASYYMSRLDYKYNPRKGIALDIFAGAGFKNIVDAKDAIDSLNVKLDNKNVEIESGIDLDIYVPIYKNIVFHFGNTSRYLDQFSEKGADNLLFENELYRFGGANSLRGFDENIFYASIYSLQNAELKYLFETNSAFYVFWNGAYYYKNIAKSVTEDFPWGFGIGLDFDTRAGIFSLSYALGKQFNNPFEIQTAKIHFGYISRF